MTLRIQSRFGKKVEFMESAIAYTYSPTTIMGFWKQMIRWRRGFLREAILMWKEPKKNIKLMFLDVQFNVLQQTAMPIFKILIFYSLIFHFSFWNLLVFFAWSIFTSMFYLTYFAVNNPKRIIYAIGYSFYYDFIFNFTMIPSWFGIRKQGKWATR